MINGLNIPLYDPATRRNSWRVVWILFIAISTFFICWSAFRILTHIDHVSAQRPENASYTVTFALTSRTTRILSDKIGQQTAFFGQPWVFSDFINDSGSIMSLHYNEDQLAGISIDGRIDPNKKQAFIDRGLYVTENKSVTSIATTDNFRASQGFWHDSVLSARWINPRITGFSIAHDTESTSSFSLNQRGITVREKNPIPDASLYFSYPENLHILAFSPLDTSLIGSFLPTLDKKTAIVLIGEDNEGAAIYISTQTGETDINTLAEEAQEIISRQTLSTTALTLPDGDSVQEVRTQQGAITPTISSEGDTMYVSLENETGDRVVAQTDDGHMTIANRSFELVAEGTPPRSSCNPHYPFFARPTELAQLTFEPVSEPLLPPNDFSGLFSELAWKSKRSLFCW